MVKKIENIPVKHIFCIISHMIPTRLIKYSLEVTVGYIISYISVLCAF